MKIFLSISRDYSTILRIKKYELLLKLLYLLATLYHIYKF